LNDLCDFIRSPFPPFSGYFETVFGVLPCKSGVLVFLALCVTGLKHAQRLVVHPDLHEHFAIFFMLYRSIPFSYIDIANTRPYIPRDIIVHHAPECILISCCKSVNRFIEIVATESRFSKAVPNRAAGALTPAFTSPSRAVATGNEL
jgi:hypothetical protein